MPEASSYDLIAPYYDWDMGLNNPGCDIVFYRNEALSGGGTVLELGCGTGRVALPLALAGCEVVGLDRSMPMLQQLQNKITRLKRMLPLRLLCGDMRSFGFQISFGQIICPYSIFNYLTEEEDRLSFLQCAKKHIRRGGRLILDTFVPDHGITHAPPDHVFFDYRREIAPGIFLERTRTIREDAASRTCVRTRHYRELREDGTPLKTFATKDRIRLWFQDELEAYVTSHGFGIEAVYGGFEHQPYSDKATTMVFVLRC